MMARIGRHGKACRALAKASLSALALAWTCAPTAAHHSVAQYDLTTPSRKSVSGTVKKVEWQNPHAWLWLDVPGSDGKAAQWGGEMSSLGALRNAGFKWNSVSVGQKISLLLAPARDGRNSGLVLRVTWDDGKFWEPTGSASPLPPAGQQAPGQQAGDPVQNAPQAQPGTYN
jgi:hypothetical protein